MSTEAASPSPAARQKIRLGEGTWRVGLGLALAAQGKYGEARDAYAQALASGNLSEKLEAFARARLAE